jgi:hypothetical protein
MRRRSIARAGTSPTRPTLKLSGRRGLSEDCSATALHGLVAENDQGAGRSGQVRVDMGREGAMTNEWGKARMAEVDADEKLIFSRLMTQATPDERKALERLIGGARAYVLALDETAKAEAK